MSNGDCREEFPQYFSKNYLNRNSTWQSLLRDGNGLTRFTLRANPKVFIASFTAHSLANEFLPVLPVYDLSTKFARRPPQHLLVKSSLIFSSTPPISISLSNPFLQASFSIIYDSSQPGTLSSSLSFTHSPNLSEVLHS
jgi:hypothetical protein